MLTKRSIGTIFVFFCIMCIALAQEEVQQQQQVDQQPDLSDANQEQINTQSENNQSGETENQTSGEQQTTTKQKKKSKYPPGGKGRPERSDPRQNFKIDPRIAAAQFDPRKQGQQGQNPYKPRFQPMKGKREISEEEKQLREEIKEAETNWRRDWPNMTEDDKAAVFEKRAEFRKRRDEIWKKRKISNPDL